MAQSRKKDGIALPVPLAIRQKERPKSEFLGRRNLSFADISRKKNGRTFAILQANIPHKRRQNIAKCDKRRDLARACPKRADFRVCRTIVGNFGEFSAFCKPFLHLLPIAASRASPGLPA
jgi:hypothetical protein